jgi:hypothetical protein
MLLEIRMLARIEVASRKRIGLLVLLRLFSLFRNVDRSLGPFN